MTREELMRMLDLRAKPSSRTDELNIQALLPEDDKPEDKLDGGLTVLNCDEWEVAHGERLALSPPAGLQGNWSAIMADCFAAAFRQSPAVERHCGDEVFQGFMTTLLDSPDFAVLHESTCADVLASDLAAAEFARQFAELDKTLAQADQKEDAGLPGGLDDAQREAAQLRAIGQALQAAQEQVDELEDVETALGMGGDGADAQTMDPAQVAKLFQRVRNNSRLKRICELAGRYRRVAQSKQRQKTSHGYDDMVGVEMGGDVSRLLPLEMAQLADEDFELDALRRLVEQQSMCRQFRGVENQAKGPIIVCVDESGSMDGEPVANAKAFALAMAWIAQHQGRWCGLVSYSGGTEGKLLALPPGKWNQERLAEWLEHFYSGGTDMDVPLKELPERYWQQLGAPRGKTDVILITDALCHVPDRMRDNFNAWKLRENVRCISLIIGQAGAGGLKDVSDEIHLVRTIDVADDSVTSCFSV